MSCENAQVTVNDRPLHKFRRLYGVFDLPNVSVQIVTESSDLTWSDSALNTATKDMLNYFQRKKPAPAFPADFF